MLLVIRPSTVVEVSNYKDLLAAWKLHGQTGLVGRFAVREPLTPSQLGKLPPGLRPLVELPDESLAFLERLYSLEDPRA